MVKLDLKLDAEAVNGLLRRAFPDADPDAIGKVTEVEPGRVHMVAPYRSGILRPGGVISGATLMGIADNAAYALVFGILLLTLAIRLRSHAAQPPRTRAAA